MRRISLIAGIIALALHFAADASTIVTRSGEGTTLTWTQVDTNFKIAAQAKTTNYTIVIGDNRDTIEFNGSSLTATMPAAATIVASADTADFEVTIKNLNSTALTIARSSTDTFDGATSLSLKQYDSVTLKVNNAASGYNVISAKYNGTWTSNNDGSGSGLDADTLDSHDTSYFATSGANSNITSMSGITGDIVLANNTGFIQVKESGGTARSVLGMTSGNAMLIGTNSDALKFYSSVIPTWYDGTTTHTTADLDSTQTFTNKTLTSPTISGGSITGITDLAVADGGTGASTAATARSNLSAAASGANGDITSMTALTQVPKKIGSGVAPSSWGGSYYPIDLGTAGAVYSSTSGAALSFNAYQNGTNWIYKTSAAASLLAIGTTLDFWSASSGTAGNTATFSDVFSINSSGDVTTGIWQGTAVGLSYGGTGATSASAARTNLGLGTIATQAASSVAITGGSITGITDLAVADGGTGSSTASGARTNLGLGTIATQAASSVAITGGAIDGTAIGGSTPAAGAFTTGAFSGAVSSTKSCASGYTRISPNYCRVTSLPATQVTLTRDSCTTVSAPTGALMLDMSFRAIAFSANAIAVRSSSVDAYTSSACSQVIDGLEAAAAAYEASAISAGTEMANDENTVSIPVSSGNVYLKQVDDSGNHGTGYYTTVGYKD